MRTIIENRLEELLFVVKHFVNITGFVVMLTGMFLIEFALYLAVLLVVSLTMLF